MTFPEIAEEIRHASPVQPAKGGRITEVWLKLTNGRHIHYFELAYAGQVQIAEALRDLLEVVFSRKEV